MKSNLIKKSMKKTKTFLIIFLFFLFLSPLYAEEIPCVWTGIEEIIAVGDLHGDYENFIRILKGTRLTDSELRWTGGKAFFVQTGDVMDRGPDARKIFDLIMRLEKEAEKAGGKVQMLLGNHEEMNITGIAFDYPDYVTVEQFVSFLPEDYRQKKEREFRKRMEKGKDLRDYWKEVLKKDKEARKKYISNFNEKYGKWILEHNAVIKINDIIFVHGGMSEKYSKWKLEDINNRLRSELTELQWAAVNSQSPKNLNPEIVYKSDGPLWYRQLAVEDEEIFKAEVDRILLNLKAKYMVIAHTPRLVVSINDMRRFDGKIWIVDTGISKAYGGHLSALIINNGNFSLWGVSNEN